MDDLSKLLQVMPSSNGTHNSKPVWEYDSVIHSIPTNRANPRLLGNNLDAVLDSDNYTNFVVGVPMVVIAGKDSFRTCIHVPPESYLVMLNCIGLIPQVKFGDITTSFRLQIFDDGAGEYMYSSPSSSKLIGGNYFDNIPLFGSYVLPSPMAVTHPGKLTLNICNVNRTDTTTAHIALYFAIPKTCKDRSSGRGVVTRRLN